MPNATDPKEAARVAKQLSFELRAAFDKILRDHNVPDWRLQSFTLARRTAEAAECPSGEEYDCRYVGTSVVCKCWPS
jgi:hypothetical protein